MIEKIVIIIIAALNQSSIAVSNAYGTDVMSIFTNKGSVNENYVSGRTENWKYLVENANIAGSLNVLPVKKDGAINPEINSKAAVVMDAGTNTILFLKDADRKMPLASITKFMAAMVAIDNIDLDEKVAISERAIKEGGKKEGLYAGEEIRAEDLLKMMLVNSNNVAAEAMADHLDRNPGGFMKLMNDKAKLLGLSSTKFFNASGLDREEENYSTAKDIAQMFDYGLKYQRIWEILRIQKSEVWSIDKKTKHILKSTNKLLGKIQNIEGGKTGFTDDAGECMVLVAGDPKGNNRIISVVLNSSDRFKDTQNLVKWVFDNFTW